MYRSLSLNMCKRVGETEAALSRKKVKLPHGCIRFGQSDQGDMLRQQGTVAPIPEVPEVTTGHKGGALMLPKNSESPSTHLMKSGKGLFSQKAQGESHQPLLLR